MFKAKAEPERQRMSIVSDQALKGDDVGRLIASILSESGKLKPGWVAAVDFRGMWINDSFINEHFRRLQEVLLSVGARKIGTLLDSDALKMRLWQSGAQTRSNALTQRFHDAGEWEKFLTQA
jgi:hypothetical protein